MSGSRVSCSVHAGTALEDNSLFLFFSPLFLLLKHARNISEFENHFRYLFILKVIIDLVHVAF